MTPQAHRVDDDRLRPIDVIALLIVLPLFVVLLALVLGFAPVAVK